MSSTINSEPITSCCICLENKDILVNCAHCKDGKYCEECITTIIYNNNYNKCAICRQENWHGDSCKDIINNYTNVAIDINSVNSYVYINKYILFINIFIAMIAFSACTLVGMLFVITICEYNVFIHERPITNTIMIILLYCLTGVCISILCVVVAYINIQLYKLVKTHYGNECAAWTCNPLFIIWIMFYSIFLTNQTFNASHIKLCFNKLLDIILKLLLGYLLGIAIIIIVASGLIRIKCNRTNELREQSIETTIEL